MGFYDLSELEREKLVKKVEQEIHEDLLKNSQKNVIKYFSNEDTYIRKTAYFAISRVYFSESTLTSQIITTLTELFQNRNEAVRQTVVNALGEIGKKDAQKALPIYEKAMIDEAHEVRNAVIGSLKKMGEKNPQPVLEFSKKFLQNPDPEIRRQAVHGIELRGRTHPEDILPLLEQLQHEQNKRVRETVIHVLGQISYKKGCLERVIAALKTWKNKGLVNSALAEILETHKSYEKFSTKSLKEAEEYIKKNFNH